MEELLKPEILEMLRPVPATFGERAVIQARTPEETEATARSAAEMFQVITLDRHQAPVYELATADPPATRRLADPERERHEQETARTTAHAEEPATSTPDRTAEVIELAQATTNHEDASTPKPATDTPRGPVAETATTPDGCQVVDLPQKPRRRKNLKKAVGEWTALQMSFDFEE